MSLHTVGSSQQYVLPASQDAVPEAFRSNRMAKPINCSMQTVNVPALTGNASNSGTSVIQVPCGASAGIMCNPYIRFAFQATGPTGVALSTFKFKGATNSGTSLINRVATYVNSVQVDNIQNADQVYDQLFAHSTSYDWLSHDATQLMYSNATFAYGAATASGTAHMCVPLIGLLGSQQAMPLYLINGQLQIQLDWNSAVRALYDNNGLAATNITGFTISSVQLVYDRVQPEQAFIDHVRSQMMGGQKYVYGYTNYQCTTLASAANSTFNYGLNVSSLRGVIANQVATADLSAITSEGNSVYNGLSQFSVQLDGRLISSLTLDATTAPAVAFAELQKSQSRIFDASITDLVSATVVAVNSTITSTYWTEAFAVGQSCQRVNEGLAFSGSPVSVVTLSLSSANSAACTLFVVFISDMQVLVDGSGSIEIVR